MLSFNSLNLRPSCWCPRTFPPPPDCPTHPHTCALNPWTAPHPPQSSAFGSFLSIILPAAVLTGFSVIASSAVKKNLLFSLIYVDLLMSHGCSFSCLLFFFYNFSNFQRFYFQNPWTEVRQDTEGVKWPFVVCKWCIFHWRWTSHHQCFVWWHSQGTMSKWCGCACKLCNICLCYNIFLFMSYFRFGTQNLANASTHSNLCPGHQKSPSTMWFPCPKIQSTLWFVTTRTR